jgi:hypothetical chaperone protein
LLYRSDTARPDGTSGSSNPVGSATSVGIDFGTLTVCDFGGGTSDFSLLCFRRRGSGVTVTPIGHAGLAIAGDSFDYRIIDAVVSPLLGKGTLFKSLDKILPIPQHYHARFARWHRDAQDPPRAGAAAGGLFVPPPQDAKLLDVIRDDSGFNIYRAVSDAEVRLSSAATASFVLRLGDLDIEQEISRRDFERWIADDVAKIERTVEQLLQTKGIALEAIDGVFLTGGSSFIPAVRRVFETRFGTQRLADGENFQSVAFRLALIGLEDDLRPWLAQSPGE